MEVQVIEATPVALPPPSQDDVRLVVASKPDEAARAIFNFNKHALAAAMRAIGFTSVVVTYTGDGDSGQIDEIGFQPPDIEEGLNKAVVAQMRYRWDEERHCGGSELVFEEMHLGSIAEALCDTAISLGGHDGYENNDGGCGEFTLQASDASAVLEHTDYYTESDTSTHEL